MSELTMADLYFGDQETIKRQAAEIETLSTKLDEVAEYYAKHYKGDPWREFEKQAETIAQLRKDLAYWTAEDRV